MTNDHREELVSKTNRQDKKRETINYAYNNEKNHSNNKDNNLPPQHTPNVSDGWCVQ